MEVLKDKQTKSYEYISRYATFPYYYHKEDNKYVYGMTNLLSDDTTYVVHNVSQEDTLDSLAFKYYGRPDYYWVIGYFNNINDPFEKLSNRFTTIKVPSLSNVQFK